MSWLVDLVAVPLSYDFMRRALLVAVMVGTVSALLSCYLVLKGWALMGDAVSHAVLPGLVLAHVAGLPMSLGAFLAGLACAGLTGWIRESSRVKEDTAMGIVFAGMFALGLVLFTKIATDQHLDHVLFGNLLGITWAGVGETALVAGAVSATVLLLRRDLMLYCFDAAHARAIGLPVRALHYGLLSLLALAIVASLEAVGVILVVAMLVAPGAIASLVTRRFGAMQAVAVAAAVASSVVGTLVSFHIDGATGPAIVVVQALLFSVVLVVVRRREARARQAAPHHPR
jgi:manganese/iron transport system permease protein